MAMPYLRKSPTAAKLFAARRAALIDGLVRLVLEQGLNDLSLRSAAAKLGTSDRMLLYYFSNKADLVLAVLKRLSERQLEVLRVTRDAPRRAPAALLLRAWTLVSNPEIKPLMRIWAEVSFRGLQGEEPFRQIARQTVDTWLTWIDSRLDMRPGKNRKRIAAAIFTILQGATLLESARPGATEGVGNLLCEGLRKLDPKAVTATTRRRLEAMLPGSEF